MNDLRYALRIFLKSPGFTLVAVLALALGIGANTAIFTVVDGVLLRPLPYPNPERIVMLDRLYQGNVIGGAISAAKYRFWKEQSRSFESAAAFDIFGSGVNLTGAGETERVASARVSSEFFRVLGVEPVLGRSFTEDEDGPGGPCVAVITSRLWHQRFGGDTAIASRAVTMNGEPCVITGVLPSSFRFRVDADIFTPMRIAGMPRNRDNPYNMLARLKPGVTLDAARAELQTVFARFAAANGDLVERGEVGIHVESYLDRMVGDVRPSLWVLMGAVGLVLLIACANVANLLLSRATGRVKEMAVRTALGASRLRLARQLMVESVVLALVGGGCGVLLAVWGVPVLLRLAPGDLPRSGDIAVDLRVIAFSLLLSGLTGLIFGVAPALRSSRVGSNPGSGRIQTRGLLIASEVALSLVLLVGAALLMRSFVALRSVSPGFDSHGVVAFRMSPGPGYSTTGRLWDLERQALERIRAIPGIDEAGTGMSVPLEPWPDFPTEILGRPERTIVEPKYLSVSPGFFPTFAIPLVRGRVFTEKDTTSSTPVAMINQTMARKVFKDRNPLGERVLIGAPGDALTDSPRVIIGVIGDVHESSLDRPPDMAVFVPRSQVPNGLTDLANHVLPMSWVVRTKLPISQVADAVRKAVLAVDARQPLSNMRTMDWVISSAVARQQFNLLLMGVFAGIALLLAAVGIYGVVSYQVGQRARELGIRVALGATRGQILRVVVGQGLKPIAAGLVAGLIATLGLTRLIQALLYQVSPRDPWTIAAISAMLAAVACLACYLPARRATKIDPIAALRCE